MSQPVWDGTGVPPSTGAATTSDAGGDAGYNPADHTVAEVVAYLDDHPEEASAVLAAEADGKARVTLRDYTRPEPAQVEDADGNPIEPSPDGLVTLTPNPDDQE